MSFDENQTSLSGIVDPIRYVNVDEFMEGNYKRNTKIKNSIILVIISAIIFVSVISLFDLIRNVIKFYFTIKTANNSIFSNNEKTKEILIADNQFYAHIIFTLLTVLLAVLCISFITKFYTTNGKK